MKRKRYTVPLFILIAIILMAVLGNIYEQVFPFLNAILMIGIPLVLGLYLARKFKLDLALFGIGALTFIASQVFHIPFNQWILNPLIDRLGLQPAPGNLDLAIVGLLFGLSAGVFEESARYIVYHRWLKRNRTWEEGLMFGVGHGGIEAIILGLLAMWGFLQLVAFRDLNPEILSGILSPENIEVVRSFWNAPWYFNLLGAVERAAAICIHLSATLLILQAFRRKNIGWFFLAVLWHTAVDAFAVFGISTWSVYIVEGIVVLFGLCSLGIVFTLRKSRQISEEESQDAQVESKPLPQLSVEPDEITQEKLEDSQYD